MNTRTSPASAKGRFSRYPLAADFIRLARLDKPIGTYLLLWPTLAALWIAADGYPGWHLLLVFALGTLFARSAGCVVNDLADRNFDGEVARTKDRPLATGRITPAQAWLFTAALLLPALLLVLTTNQTTALMSVPAAVIAAIYPLMKRYIYLPQAVLGVAFSWGILMAFTATQNTLPTVAWLLLLANLLWVVAYDTQYAMVDREDDLRLGLKSTAILFADLDRLMIGILQAAWLGALLLAALSAQLLSYWYYAGLGAAALCLIYQQYLIRHRERADCFRAFLNNHWAGLAVFVGVVLHYAAN